MASWKDIHPDFTEELQRDWESFGFIYEQVKEWIEDYDFSPHDADFAAYIGDNDLIISEMQKKDLAELREKYSEAVNNKETCFPFEKESKEKVSVNMKLLRNGKTESVDVKIPRLLKTADL